VRDYTYDSTKESEFSLRKFTDIFLIIVLKFGTLLMMMSMATTMIYYKFVVNEASIVRNHTLAYMQTSLGLT